MSSSSKELEIDFSQRNPFCGDDEIVVNDDNIDEVFPDPEQIPPEWIE